MLVTRLLEGYAQEGAPVHSDVVMRKGKGCHVMAHPLDDRNSEI